MKPTPGRIPVFAGLLVMCTALAAGAAPAAGEDLAVPGGTKALFATAGIKLPPERWGRLLTLVRVLHGTPDGGSEKTTASLADLAKYLTTITEFQNALGPETHVTLAKAGQKADRERLKRIFDLIALQLREHDRVYRVEQTDDRDGNERRALLARAGVVLDGLEKRLNAGETIDLAVPSEAAPLPLPVKVWSERVFERPVAADHLLAAIVLDRRAALLYHGLASLDEPTLAFLASDPDLLSTIYRDEAAVFSTFGGSVHVRQGAIVLPGGDDARPLWEALVDEKTARPARFLRKLLERDDGRVAWFYNTVQHLDGPRRRFVLCRASRAGDARETCVMDVYAVFREFQPGWKLPDRPFTRCASDPVTALWQLRVTGNGELAGPAWRRLWEAAFDRSDLPDKPARDMRDVARDGNMDAPWLLRALSVERITLRRFRLAAVTLAQRLFPTATVQAAPDIFVAACALAQYEGLMFTLERAGVSDPAVYARAAVIARDVVDGVGTEGLPLQLAGFQGPLAFLQHAAGTPALDRVAAEALVKSFLDIPRGHDAPRGGLARWVEAQLLPRMPAPRPGDEAQAPAETAMLRALAGSTGAAPVPAVQWEDRAYRVDIAAAEFARLQQIRGKQRDNAVDAALRLWRVAAALSDASAKIDVAKSCAAQLREIGKTLQPLAPGPLLGAQPPDAKQAIQDAVSELGKVRKPKDAKKLPRIAGPLAELADAMLAQTFASLAYAVAIGDPRSAVLIAGNAALQHDFQSKDTPEAERPRTPWTIAAEQAGLQGRWHMLGSLLGVDIGLARLGLRRVSSEPPDHPPTLNENDVRTLQQGVALMNPFALTDGARDAIAGAIKRGRERVGRLAADPSAFDTVAADARLDEWRRQAMRWMARNEPDRLAALFSLSELLRLGQPSVDPSALDAWGGVMIPFDGSFRLAMPGDLTWDEMSGRPMTGLLAAMVPDVNLRVAEALSDRHLPALLGRSVLSAAMQAFLDAADLNDDDDWAAAMGAARDLTDGCLDDCVSALTAGGPLVPVHTDGTPIR